MNTPPPLAAADPANRPCPYQGLQPYTEKDQEYFFGREEDQETIVANLVTTPLTILYGASGVGKSSVLMAGVVPLLRQMGKLGIVIFRSWQDPDPVSALQSEVLAALQLAPEQIGAADPRVPFDEFLLRASRVSHTRLVLIFDQFEEYFLYHPVEDSPHFDAAFARAVNRSDITANFLISVREDSLSKLDRFHARIPNLLNNLLRLEYLNREDAAAAIRKPLAAYNQKHPTEETFEVEADLVNAVLEQVQTGRVSLGQGAENTTALLFSRARRQGSIETPFLQMVLIRLWQTEVQQKSRILRKATLDLLQGAQTIVRTHLDEAMASLPASGQDLAAAVFHYLVTPSGMKIAYTVKDLAAYTGTDANALKPMLENLCGADLRILRKVPPPPDQPQMVRFEIYHDVLAPAVLDWRLRHLAAAQIARQKSLEEQLARERQEAGRQLGWLPWIAGFLCDLLLCLPIGPFITTALLRTRSTTLSRQAAATMRLVWFSTWVVALVAYFVIVGLLLNLFEAERTKGSQTFSEVFDTIMMMVLYVPRTLAGPLAGWLLYRRASRRAALEPQKLPQEAAPLPDAFKVFPWLLGGVADLFLCLPVGAWVAGAILQNRKSSTSREAIVWARTAWVLSWIGVGLVWLLAIGLAFGASSNDKPVELTNGETAAVMVTMALRALVAPVIGWLTYRYKIARLAPPPAPAGAVPPLVSRG